MPIWSKSAVGHEGIDLFDQIGIQRQGDFRFGHRSMMTYHTSRRSSLTKTLHPMEPTLARRGSSRDVRTHLINGASTEGGEAPSKARRPRIPGVFERGATPLGGMHRRPSAVPIY